MKKWIIGAALLISLGAFGAIGYGIYTLYFSHPGRFSSEISTEGLRRTVEGNTLTSHAHPAARITFPAEYQYLGAHRFILYGTVEAEQYMFASAHPDGSTRALVNVQFETLLPEVEGVYDYSTAPRAIGIGPLDFDVDAEPVRRHWLVPNGLPGTDGERYRSYADDRGFPLPKDFIWSRFVYVPADAPRNEMLILHIADLAEQGLSAPSLRSGGENADLWKGLVDEHLNEVSRSIKVEALD